MYNMYQFAISELVVRRTLQLFEVHNGGGTREAWAKVEYLMPKNYSQRVVSGAIDPAVLKENKHQLELASSLPSYTPFRRALQHRSKQRERQLQYLGHPLKLHPSKAVHLRAKNHLLQARLLQLPQSNE